MPVDPICLTGLPGPQRKAERSSGIFMFNTLSLIFFINKEYNLDNLPCHGKLLNDWWFRVQTPPRLDAPGVLHHVIIRSMRRRKIIMDNKDREDFLVVGDRERGDEGAGSSEL